MASFTDLIAQCICAQKNELLASLSINPNDDIEQALATSIQAHWHPFIAGNMKSKEQPQLRIGAVDGSRAVRSLNIGSDWIVAQALLIGPDGWRDSEGDTRIIRGDVEHPEVDRTASLLMRSLELDLALRFVQQKRGNVLLLDGSLYSDLPYLLYNLAIGGYEDLPHRVLEQYLDLFELCQQSEVLLLGVAKSTRSTIFGRALLRESFPGSALPSDGELLYRWTEGCGLTSPVLLGSASFGHTSAPLIAQLAINTKQTIAHAHLLSTKIPDLSQEQFSRLQTKLLAAPAIGTFYARLAPGDDILRIDALASSLGRKEQRLLEFDHELV
ncbi:MAG TPA: DNA double-strand break repair nuclease NurA, partial [Ktedonobacteraceae bacterium]|nr:DNA double-strand break repair nuclease NurA [Ktedonobacteraceae bacterium]